MLTFESGFSARKLENRRCTVVVCRIERADLELPEPASVLVRFRRSGIGRVFCNPFIKIEIVFLITFTDFRFQ